MVELIKSSNRRSVLASFLHALFYVIYAVILLVLLVVFPTAPWAALTLVVVSKWRVVAVRPRYWWANILSNLPDTLLGLGIVILMWSSASLPIQIVLTLGHIAWLVYLKPKHTRHMMMIQAGISQFVAIWALFIVGHMLPEWIVVIMVFVIGFSSARHALSTYDEADRGLLSLVWGFLVAQLGFVAWHWTIAYSISPTLKIPQIAIIISAIAMLAERGYAAWYDDGRISWSEMKWPTIFVGLVLVILLMMFSGLWDASTL